MDCNCEKCGGKILGLAHIGIRVRDLEESIKFYTETLGFELTARQQPGSSKLAFLHIGTCLLELIQPDPFEPREPGQIDHIAVEVTGIESLVCRLIEKRVHFLNDDIMFHPNLLGGVKNIFFTGPDGERIEFFEYVK